MLKRPSPSEIATTAFKKGNFLVASKKYSKALRYLDVHSVLPTDNTRPSPEKISTFTALKLSLLLNSALAAIKITPKPDARLAIKSATKALGMHKDAEELEKSDKEMPGWHRTLTSQERCAYSRSTRNAS